MQTKTKMLILLLLSGLTLSACGGQPEPLPTPDIALIQTLVRRGLVELASEVWPPSRLG